MADKGFPSRWTIVKRGSITNATGRIFNWLFDKSIWCKEEKVFQYSSDSGNVWISAPAKEI